MAAFGLAVLLSGLRSPTRRCSTSSRGLADSLALAIFVHLLLASRPGGWRTGVARVVAALVVAAAAGRGRCSAIRPAIRGAPTARNPLLVESHEASPRPRWRSRALGRRSRSPPSCCSPAGARARRSSAARSRRSLVAAAVLLGLAAVSISAQALDLSDGVQKAAQLVFIAGFAALPVAFLAGLVRSRFFRAATVGGVIERLTHGRGGDGVEDALASALGDPSLAVAFWLPERDGYVDREGRPIALPARATARSPPRSPTRAGASARSSTTPRWASDPELMRAAAGAAGLALENDRLEVELRARLQALRASRTRIVEAGDAERRRLGRDLHDGAQQRLVALLLDLQLARERWDDQPERSRALVDDALEHARAAVEELRDLASGIHPAVLSQRGLDAALESLADALARCPSSSTSRSTSGSRPAPRPRPTSSSPRR